MRGISMSFECRGDLGRYSGAAPDTNRECMSEHAIVLGIQDTTELDFNGQETDALGPLSYEGNVACSCIRPTRSRLIARHLACWTRGCGRAKCAARMPSDLG